ncbi:SSU ribosomal protein S9P [Obba rivulosa]|uniref:SSU ribosomal protein S9P n=1 Tax=Obba rivulosa TaxID=1052685 RepID=A0A8E2B4I4_9APHY|nr:SSU ribosomal protein S9P [Obba rivulosa]
MNVLQQMQRVSAIVGRRTYATTFVPPASLENVARRRDSGKPLPQSPNIYTGRPSYYDQLNALETALQHTQRALRNLQLLPLPQFARDAIPPPNPVWKNKRVLAEEIAESLTVTRYRRVINLLNQLDECRRIADVAGHHSLAESLARVLQDFEPANKEAVLARGKRKPVKIDEYGRSYTIGRRKESTARVWVIPVQDKTGETSTTSVQTPEAPLEDELSAGEVENEGSKAPESLLDPVPDVPPAPVEVTTTNILINNTPLVQYFAHQADRETVVRPFKIAGLLGAFNVFAIVRGGGTTGQSGAISLGIARALVAHVPKVETILRKAKLLRRDPRMVERKKTGLAKAREAYTWVKR